MGNNIFNSRFRFLNEFIEKQRKLLRSLGSQSFEDWDLKNPLPTGKAIKELLSETVSNVIPTLYRVGKLVRKGLVPSDNTPYSKIEEIIEESQLTKTDWLTMKKLQNDFRSQYKATISTIGDLYEAYSHKGRIEMGISQVENLGGTTIRTTGYSAFLHGVAQGEGPLNENSKCCKILMPNACRYCQKAYLTSNGYPRIFTIQELAQNGDAINNKDLLKPVLGQLHFNCRCLLLILSDDLTDKERTNLISRAEKDYCKLYYQLRKENLTK